MAVMSVQMIETAVESAEMSKTAAKSAQVINMAAESVERIKTAYKREEMMTNILAAMKYLAPQLHLQDQEAQEDEMDLPIYS